MKGWNPSPRLGCLCHLSWIGMGNWCVRSLRPVSLCHCLIRKANSFLYAWPSFAICAVTFPVRSRKKNGRRRAQTSLVASGVESRADACGSDHCQADSHCHHRRQRRCRGTCPDLHTTLAGTRKYHSRLSGAAWSEYESRLWQDAHCELRGCQETSRLREAFEHCPALDRFCTSPFPQSLSALWSPLEANQDLWR